MELNNKVSVRQVALQGALQMVTAYIGHGVKYRRADIIDIAKLFEEYLTGDADLPESSKDHVPEYFDECLKLIKTSQEDIKRGFQQPTIDNIFGSIHRQ